MPNPSRTLESQLAAARQRLAELESREAAHQRAEQVQTALYRIADAALSTSSGSGGGLAAFYVAVHQIVGELMAANNFYIALYDHARQMINFPYYMDEVDPDIPAPNLWEKMGLGEARGLTAYLLRHGQPYLLARADQDELARRGELEIVGAPSTYWLGVPLKTDEGTIGALVVQSYTAGVTYTDQDLTLLNFVGQHIATALERVRLLDETRRLLKETEERNAELAIINSVQAGLVAELDMQAIYDLVGDQLRDVFDAQVVDIGLYDSAENLLHFPYTIERGVRFPDEPIPLIGFRKHVMETRKPLLVNENAVELAAKYGNPGAIQGEVPKSTLWVPMIVGSEAKGVISLQNLDREHAFSDSDVRLLTTLANSMSIALENARLFAETQRLLKETSERNAELAIINSISEGLVKQLDFQAIIDLVGDKIRNIFAAQVVTISLYNPQTNLIHHRYTVELEQRFFFDEPQAIDPDRLEIIQTRQPLRFGTSQEIIEHSGEGVLDGEMPQSYLGVPMILGSEVTGVITVQDLDRQHAFGDSDVRLLSTLAANMGVALENARLFDETTRLLKETSERNAELAIINNIQQGLAAELDMQAIYDLVGDQIRDIFDAQVVDIGLYDSQKNLLHFPYTIERGVRFHDEPMLLIGFRKHVMATRQPLLVNENMVEMAAQYGNPLVFQGEPSKAWLGVPMIVGNEAKGVISLQNLDHEHAFSDSDVRLLTTLVNSMSVALENVRLFEAEQAQARRQEALFRLSAALAAAADEAEICQQLVAGLQDEALGYAYVGVFLVDAASGERVLRAAAGLSTAEIGLRLGAGQGLSERPLLDGQSHYTPDVTRAAAYVPSLSSGAEVDAPLKIGPQVVGVLTVESHQPNAFDQHDFDTLTSAAAQAGVALGQARSLAETHQRAAELATVNSIGQAISAQLDLAALIELVGEQMRQTFNADIVYLALHDRQSNMIHFPYYFGDSSPPRPFGQGLTSRIIETGQPLLINQEVTERASQMQIEAIGKEALSYLGVPIIAGQQAIGVISVQSTSQEGRFDEADLNLLNTIAANVGAAMQNAQLYQETQRRSEEMAILAEIGNDIAATRELEPVLERITTRAKALLQVRDIALYLLEPDGQTFRAAVVLGQYAAEIKADSVLLGRGISGHVAQSGQAELVNYPARDPRVRHIAGTPEEEDEAEAIMVAPLLSRGRVIGLMTVWRPHAAGLFNPSELDFLVSLARQAAIAIESGRLYLETQRRADEMSALAEVGREISATLDVQSVLEQIAAHARRLLATDDSAIYLPQPDGQSFKAIVALGEFADEIKADIIGLGEGIIGDIAQSGVAEVVNYAITDPRSLPESGIPVEEQEIDHLMAVPLWAREQVIGLMAVWRRGPERPLFIQADLDFLTGLARQAAIAITNARLFEEAAVARAEAEQANQAKSAFLATMSHELRTPLNAIIGFTKIVKRKAEGALPDKQLDNLDKVLVSAEHLLGLINTILDIAKIEAGRMDVSPGEFSVEKLVDMCAVTAQPLLKTGVELVKNVEPGLPLAYSDQDKVKQILLNLLSNAAKFTHQGAVTLRVRLDEGRKTEDEGKSGVSSVPRPSSSVIFDVIDSGIGISAEALPRVFEEFQQADNSTTRQYGGTGLGLSISRKLAQLLGGDLTASSTPGQGSTFTLSVPLRYEEVALPLSSTTPLQLPPSKGESQTSPPTGGTEGRQKPLILVIDDNPEAIDLLRQHLTEASYRMAGASTASEGLKLAQELRPVAIILDVMLPDRDGWQVLHELKSSAATKDIPVILLTIVDQKALGFQLGAADYLVKPLNSEALFGTLQRLAPAANRPIRLLAIDDDPNVRDMIRQLLEGQPFEVETAEDGLTGLEAIERNPPDLILLDLMMPRLDGFGVLAHLRENPVRRAIPVVVVTAKLLTAQEIATLQQSTVQIIQKQGLSGEMLVQELQKMILK